jgi:hypothetical protein
MVNLRKIEAVLAYFANNTNGQYLGKVKLMKLFYFLDFTHVKRFGSPVTFDTYYNLEHGPIPTRIKNLVDEAADNEEGSVLREVIKCEFPQGTDMCKIVPNRDSTEEDKLLFSESEFAILEEIANRFKNSKTQEIEEASHLESPWSETSLLDKIPYYLAAHDADSLVSEDEIKLALL